MSNIEKLAKENGMTVEFVNWFFETKKDGCGNVWFMMMAAMWEGWKSQEARCRALAAENAHMQQVIGEVQILYCESDGIVGYHLNGEVAKWDDVMPDLWAETPATDDFLAEVRASCVDAVKQKISDAISGCYQDEMAGLDAAVNIASDFAAQLRKGVQS